jgi:hypothetical protein
MKRAAKHPPAWTPFVEADNGGPDLVLFNSRYQVTVHPYQVPGGTAHWLAIVRRDREAIHDWRDLQRLKNEVTDPEREALEIYPAESRLVDTNNQFHLFVLPAGVSLDIGFDQRDVADETQVTGAHKQRPFEERPKDCNVRMLLDRRQVARVRRPAGKVIP